MDFGFDPSETVLVQTVTLQEQEEDDPQAAPFVEENPCLLCGHKAFANFIDISYGTSCTSTTVTPVKKKLREILGKIWSCKTENQTLCLACYELVDRFDSLESQLKAIRENISDKFCRTNFKTNGKPKIGSSSKKRRQPGRSKKGTKKSKSDVDSDIDDNDNEPNTYTLEIYQGDNDPEYIPQGDQPQGQNKDVMEAPQFQLLDIADAAPNPNVYDEHHQLLQRGEKIRLGAHQVGADGVTSYRCAYCPQIWDHITSLHAHVHTVHQPEVINVAIPPELGLGNTMNCGVEIQNCQEPPDNPKPWSCLFCDAQFRARTNMSSHFKERHTPHKPFLCSDCGDSFRKGIDLNRHKLYFCANRVVSLAPKRRYKKREKKEKPPKLKIKMEEKSDVSSILDIAVT